MSEIGVFSLFFVILEIWGFLIMRGKGNFRSVFAHVQTKKREKAI